MAGTWRVTGDTPDQYSFDNPGNPVLGHVIAFVTGNNNRGSVFVANDHYSAANVRKLIEAQAVIADEVAGLASGGQAG